MEAGSRSFQAEGTECEIGSWQVNEVFWRCEKHSDGGWRKARWSVRLEGPAHRAGGMRSRGQQLQRCWMPGVSAPAVPRGTGFLLYRGFFGIIRLTCCRFLAGPKLRGAKMDIEKNNDPA